MTEASDPTAPAGVGRAPSLWRNRDYTILWAGEAISSLGTSMSLFTYPLIGYALTRSTSLAALAGAAFALGGAILRLPAGALVDRWNRKAVMVASEGVGALIYASLAVAGLLHVLTWPHLVVAAFLTGAAGTFYDPAETAAIRAAVPAEQLPTAFSQNQTRQHLAALLGPPVGGALYALARLLPFVFDALTYTVSTLALTRLRTPLPAPVAREATTIRSDIVEGMRFMLSRGFLRAVVAFASLANVAFSALFLVIALKLLQAGVAPAAIGAVSAIGAVAGISGSLVAPAVIRRTPTGVLSLATGTLMFLAAVPMAFTDNVVVIGALLGVALFTVPAGNAAILSYLSATTPDRLQGRSLAALNFGATGLEWLGPVAGGALMAAFGGRVAMLGAAALLALAIVPLLLSTEARTLPRPDRWPAARDVDAPATAELAGAPA